MGNVGIWDPPSSVCFRMCERPSLNGMRTVETSRSSFTAADHDNFVFVLLKLIYKLINFKLRESAIPPIPVSPMMTPMTTVTTTTMMLCWEAQTLRTLHYLYIANNNRSAQIRAIW